MLALKKPLVYIIYSILISVFFAKCLTVINEFAKYYGNKSRNSIHCRICYGSILIRWRWFHRMTRVYSLEKINYNNKVERCKLQTHTYFSLKINRAFDKNMHITFFIKHVHTDISYLYYYCYYYYCCLRMANDI